eukprot:scaffold195541_cov52-Prasinocladus_malaysianus.AAC.2
MLFSKPGGPRTQQASGVRMASVYVLATSVIQRTRTGNEYHAEPPFAETTSTSTKIYSYSYYS